MNRKQLTLALEVLHEAEITPHIIGEAGVGKSQGIYQYTEEKGGVVVEVRVGLMADAGDLVGIQEFVRCKTTGEPLSSRHVLPDWFMKTVAEIEDAASQGKFVTLFFDEMSRGHKDLLQAVFELVYDRSLKGTKVRKGTFIVACSNPTTDDYAGSMEFSDDAFQDRFCHIKFEPTTDEWSQFAKLVKVDPSITDFISDYPQMLDKEHKPWNLDFVNPSRRSWIRLNKVLEIIEQKGKEYKEVELELMTGIVGEKAALAYRKFRDSYVRSLKAADILDQYQTNAMVRQSVKVAVEKDRKDMIATLQEDIIAIFVKQGTVTPTQADNLSELLNDISIELAYGMVQAMVNPQNACNAAITAGNLWNHPGIVSRVESIKQKRMEIKKLAKKK